MIIQERVILKKAIICLFLMVSLVLFGLNDISGPCNPLNTGVISIQDAEDVGKGIYLRFKPIYNRTQGGDALGVQQQSSAYVNLEEIAHPVLLIYLCSPCDRAPPSFSQRNALPNT